MIYKVKTPIIGIFKGNVPIIKVYYRRNKIWLILEEEPDSSINLIILSCFANGYWIDEYPWTDNTPWTN